jgi:hypothetical protein
LNAYAERFVLSVKSECLTKIIPLGERHLRRAVKDYTEHYHQERNHQGLDNELIGKLIDGPDMDGTVDCRERLGGILNYYYRGGQSPQAHRSQSDLAEGRVAVGRVSAQDGEAIRARCDAAGVNDASDERAEIFFESYAFEDREPRPPRVVRPLLHSDGHDALVQHLSPAPPPPLVASHVGLVDLDQPR